jgi:hypothetical protein
MTVKPRTIDNLGIETSKRYAQDRQALDAKLIDESRFIPSKAEISVVTPYIAGDLDEYLLPSTLTLWASFEPPPEYFAHAKALFSYQLIPSLGSAEKQDTDTEKLEALEDTLNKQSGQNHQGNQELQEEEKERKVLLHLLKTIGRLDRTLVMINSRRNQYQRG